MTSPRTAPRDTVPTGQVALDGLVALLDLERLELNLFRGVSPPHSPTRVFGGQVAGQALVAFSVSGDTVRRLARLHTRLPLLAFTPRPEVRSQLAMSWGVETFLVDYVTSTDAMVRQVDNAILTIGRFKPGDVVVIVAGSPPGASGSTNLIRVHRLGEEDHA